jgi:hypothetical protein
MLPEGCVLVSGVGLREGSLVLDAELAAVEETSQLAHARYWPYVLPRLVLLHVARLRSHTVPPPSLRGLSRQLQRTVGEVLELHQAGRALELGEGQAGLGVGWELVEGVVEGWRWGVGSSLAFQVLYDGFLFSECLGEVVDFAVEQFVLHLIPLEVALTLFSRHSQLVVLALQAGNRLLLLLQQSVALLPTHVPLADFAGSRLHAVPDPGERVLEAGEVLLF